MSRRLLVDALAGHFDEVVRTGERFRAGWERAGRPVAPNLARSPYAVAMVHGMLGDDERRAAWVRLTIDLGVDAERTGRIRAGLARGVRRPARAPSRRPGRGGSGGSRPTSTTPSCSGPWAAGRGGPGTPRCGRRPPCSTTTPMRRAASTAAGTPPATTRSRPPSSSAPQAIAAGDRDTLVRLAITFAQLGCPYQQARTGQIAAGPLARPRRSR